MAYMHINNLYKDPTILQFRECFALEKIHGTSANVSWRDGSVRLFSGGASHEAFSSLFDIDDLAQRFDERFDVPAGTSVTVYGEAYGGKMQRMSATYGPVLRFVAFEVKVGELWLAVPQAAACVNCLGLEFVPWQKIPADMAHIDAQRDMPSEQAVRNGIAEQKMREGVVLRPPFEVTRNNGSRIIVKHKRPEFGERKTTDVPLDPAKRERLEQASAIADEWVTSMRVRHVVDKMLADRERKTPVIQDTGEVVKRMIEDVEREAGDEIAVSKESRKAIGSAAAMIYKQVLAQDLYEGGSNE